MLSFIHIVIDSYSYLYFNIYTYIFIGANLLVTRNNVLKIADWGLARSYYSADQKFTNPVVTQWYRSPELLLGSTGYGSEIDMWSIGCLFAEMKMRPHTPLLPGKDDINQLEMIYQLLGTPTGEVESTFKTLPHWEKMSFQRTYTPRLVSRFGRAFDQNTVQLLGKFLELDPKKRITAAAALDSEYFWQDPAPAAELLPTFDVESAFAMAEDERIRDEHEKHKQQQLEQQAQQGGDTNRTGPGGRFGPGRLGGRFGGPAGRSGGRVLAQSKYAVSKPPAAPTTTATTTASAAAVVSSSSAVSAHVSSASAATTAILPIQSSVSVTTVPTADVAPTASAPATTDGTMDEAI